MEVNIRDDGMGPAISGVRSPIGRAFLSCLIKGDFRIITEVCHIPGG